MTLPRILIAAPASGSGKTLVTCGILQALVNRGLKVASFKCGPDYIDPMFHSRVIGTRSKNLDPFFVDTDTLRYLFARTAEPNDISVIEGVMGFYDGNSVTSTEASSCDVSLRLDAPVILLVNAKGASISSLATLKGFLEFSENNIKGVIFNQMSQRVFEQLKPEVEAMGVVPLGFVPKVTHLVLESRHLGLVLPGEIEALKEKLNELAGVIEQSIDLDALIELAGTAPGLEYRAPEVKPIDGKVRIGFARDDTFCFTYEDNIEILERCGAEIVYFSPMSDEHLPDVDGIILSGGYPELHGAELESNVSMLDDIFEAVDGGMPCIAECGGFMYLHDWIEDPEGNMHRGCSVIASTVTNKGKLNRFGYAVFTPAKEGGMVPVGTEVKGHEFHYWDSADCGEDWIALKSGGRMYQCMHDTGTMLVGFPHLYYYSNPDFPRMFLEKCLEYRARKGRSTSASARP